MRVDRAVDLLCDSCGVRGPHELLYLNEHLIAHRCENCGYTQTYSRHLYTDYALDLWLRSTNLPHKLAHEARSPRLLTVPARAARKPIGLLRELRRLGGFASGRGPGRGS